MAETIYFISKMSLKKVFLNKQCQNETFSSRVPLLRRFFYFAANAPGIYSYTLKLIVN